MTALSNHDMEILKDGDPDRAHDPLRVFEELAPELLKPVRQTSDLVVGDGALRENLESLTGEGC